MTYRGNDRFVLGVNNRSFLQRIEDGFPVFTPDLNSAMFFEIAERAAKFRYDRPLLSECKVYLVKMTLEPKLFAHPSN